MNTNKYSIRVTGYSNSQVYMSRGIARPMFFSHRRALQNKEQPMCDYAITSKNFRIMLLLRRSITRGSQLRYTEPAHTAPAKVKQALCPLLSPLSSRPQLEEVCESSCTGSDTEDRAFSTCCARVLKTSETGSVTEESGAGKAASRGAGS